MVYRILTRIENESDCDVLLSLLEAEEIECVIRTASTNADEYLKIIGVPADVAHEIYVKEDQYDAAMSVLRAYEENEKISRLKKSRYSKRQRIFCIMLLILIALISVVSLILNL